MNTDDDGSPRILVVTPMDWARSHPTYFFANGRASAEELAQQLLDGARALGSASASLQSTSEWFAVGAEDDWFPRARFKVPEHFAFDALTPCPELGQNRVRPEAIVAAFARDVIVLGPVGALVVKGNIASADKIHALLAEHPSWQRAVAFRGVEA